MQEQPQVVTPQSQPNQQQPAPQTQDQPGWQFRNENPAPAPVSPQPSGGSNRQSGNNQGVIDWTASEYVSHSKSAVWYLQLAFVAVIAAGLAYLLMRDVVVVATIFVVAIIFGVAAGRKPRVLHYAVDGQGITISQKKYPYSMFKSFSVIQEGPIRSIFLMPIKRFNPPMSLYYPPEGEDQITATIGSHLPQEAREQDAIDRFMHKIRF